MFRYLSSEDRLVLGKLPRRNIASCLEQATWTMASASRFAAHLQLLLSPLQLRVIGASQRILKNITLRDLLFNWFMFAWLMLAAGNVPRAAQPSQPCSFRPTGEL